MEEHLQSASIKASTANPGEIFTWIDSLQFVFLPAASVFLTCRMVALTLSLVDPMGAADNTNVSEGNRAILPKPYEHGHLVRLPRVACRVDCDPLLFPGIVLARV